MSWKLSILGINRVWFLHSSLELGKVFLEKLLFYHQLDYQQKPFVMFSVWTGYWLKGQVINRVGKIMDFGHK